MALIDSLKLGASFINDLNQGAILNQQALHSKEAFDLANELARYRTGIAGTENQYAPEKMRLANLMAQSQLNEENIRNENLPNFLNAQTNLMQNQGGLLGAKLPYASQMAQQELVASQLTNQFYAPRQQAEINKLNMAAKYPLLGMPGVAGQLGAALYMNEQGNNQSGGLTGNATPNLTSDLILKNVDASLAGKIANTDLATQRANAYKFNSLPIDFKAQLTAQAGGFGMDPLSAIKYFSSGKNLQDLAAEKGFDKNDPNNWPEPIYPTTKAALTVIQKRDQAVAELGTLNKRISSYMAPYSAKIFGYSPKQFSEALSGKDEDAQARALAARMLSPELAAVRVRALNGQVGIEAIREIGDKSLTNLKVFEALVKPNVYRKANAIVDDVINEATGVARKVGLQPGVANDSASMVKVINSKGQIGSIPIGNLPKALEAGYKKVD